MDNAGGPSRADQLDLMLTYKEQAHARTKAALTAALQRAEQAEAEAERAWHAHREMWQDRYDALDARTTEGMSAAEWQLRTGKAERRAREAEAALAQAQAERDEAQQQVAVWETVFRHSPSPVRPVAQPTALPPLPNGWEPYDEGAHTHATFKRGSDMVEAIPGSLEVVVDALATPADLITVLRHAEAAHLKLKGGAK